MWIYINNLDQVIWLAENQKWARHLNLFSMTRVNRWFLGYFKPFFFRRNYGELIHFQGKQQNCFGLFWMGVHSQRKYFALLGSIFFPFFTVHFFFKRGLVYKKANRKLQKLFPLSTMAENLADAYIHLKAITVIWAASSEKCQRLWVKCAYSDYPAHAQRTIWELLIHTICSIQWFC